MHISSFGEQSVSILTKATIGQSLSNKSGIELFIDDIPLHQKYQSSIEPWASYLAAQRSTGTPLWRPVIENQHGS
ncbi:hypothetical protein RRG08_001638 [Elysia crispata]|uniref:Uncharacterized protein n=1 Tax=Elysia crispata TaxID=231223 RepID=A0AAE1AKD6_9GAST|nr:hypothetical protein RRG08_001638 [Elysia crispata]